jgi:spore coat polysaccharide biosynthesis protein SpsF
MACRSLDGILLATTDELEDDELAAVARGLGVDVFRGSRDDVLGRILGAALAARAEIVVRITGDCPLIDPVVTDLVVDAIVEGQPCDYSSNVLRRTYPRGLDAEALTIEALERVDAMANTTIEREHVTVIIRSTHPHRFTTRSVEDDEDNSDLRWTVDEPADLELLEALFSRLDLADRVVPYPEILAEVRAHPELAGMNSRIATWSPGDAHR